MRNQESNHKEESTDSGAMAFAELLEESASYAGYQQGDIVKGVVVSKDREHVLVDIGGKTEAMLANRELERMSGNELDEIQVGDTLTVYILNPGDQDGNIIFSLRRAQQEESWQEAARLLESGEVIEAKVVDHNKGGVLAHVGQVRGFIPASHVSNASRRVMQAADSSDEPALAALVGQTLPLKVIEVDRDQNRLVLSEREAVKEARRQQKETLLAELEEGSIRQGIVSGLCSFGAFVDLGGADGLVHISELSWDHVDDPKDVLQIGDEVEVQVLKVDRQRDRIGLSMKRLHPEPWDQVDENYYIGQLVDASITKLTDFGAFARLEDGIEGLVHISELSEEHVSHPREVVQKGDSLKLRVIDIDSARRRIGLSLRRAIDQFDAEVS